MSCQTVSVFLYIRSPLPCSAGAVFFCEVQFCGVAMPSKAIDVVLGFGRREREGTIQKSKRTIIGMSFFELGVGRASIVAIVLVCNDTIVNAAIPFIIIKELKHLHEELSRDTVLLLISQLRTIHRHSRPRHIGDNLARRIFRIDIVPLASHTILEVHRQYRLLLGSDSL